MAASRFRKAIAAIPALKPCQRKGLQALSGDRARVEPAHPRLVQGSVNLDACLKKSEPHAHRWDYVIGYGEERREKVYYVEVHPASDLSGLLAKHAWLQKWLQKPQAEKLRALQSECWWVASGKIKFTRTSKEAHRLVKAKIQGPTKRLRLR